MRQRHCFLSRLGFESSDRYPRSLPSCNHPMRVSRQPSGARTCCRNLEDAFGSSYLAQVSRGPLASLLASSSGTRSDVVHRTMYGRAGRFHRDLEAYLQYQEKCCGRVINPDTVDFEDFMRYLDIEHFFGMRGTDTWSRDGNETTVLVKTLIGEILTSSTPSFDLIPQLYLHFADHLQPDDYVLTFNYDVLLERALDAVGKPYRLFPSRYKAITDRGGAIVDDSKGEVIVLKLHGSIDWFDRTSYASLEEERRKEGFSGQTPHPVFSDAEQLDVRQLLEGPRLPNDPLSQMYRVRHIERLYAKSIEFLATPWLLAPSPAKILYAGTLRDFWHGIGSAGVLNFGLSIIGYSLPTQDEYARQILHALVTNYQETHWDEDVFGLRKQPMVIVDRCQNEAEETAFRERYRFVNWDRAVFCTGGLSEHSLRIALGRT